VGKVYEMERDRNKKYQEENLKAKLGDQRQQGQLPDYFPTS
jgi:hypothetical protein